MCTKFEFPCESLPLIQKDPYLYFVSFSCLSECNDRSFCLYTDSQTSNGAKVTSVWDPWLF